MIHGFERQERTPRGRRHVSLQRVTFDVRRAHHRGGHLGVRDVHDALAGEQPEHPEALFTNVNRDTREDVCEEVLFV